MCAPRALKSHNVEKLPQVNQEITSAKPVRGITLAGLDKAVWHYPCPWITERGSGAMDYHVVVDTAFLLVAAARLWFS